MSLAVARTTERIWVSNTGLSKESKQLFRVMKGTRIHANEPVSLGWKRDLYYRAIEIGQECAQADWDGYGAVAIAPEAVTRTLQLIAELPELLQPPHLVPSPDGYISFQWHDSERRIVSVSPKEDRLVWASMLADDDSQYGKAPLWKGWPQSLIDLLQRYFSNARF
jgi:hypothetical protein